MNLFFHLQRDLVPLISAVRHNQYFNGVSAEGMKLVCHLFTIKYIVIEIFVCVDT